MREQIVFPKTLYQDKASKVGCTSKVFKRSLTSHNAPCRLMPDTHLRQQPWLHWGSLPLRRCLPPVAWRTAAAGPSSVALCGLAGSGIAGALRGACSAGRPGCLLRGAVRWPPPAASHCSRPEGGRRLQPRWQGRRMARGWVQGWGKQNWGQQETGWTRAWSILALHGEEEEREVSKEYRGHSA